MSLNCMQTTNTHCLSYLITKKMTKVLHINDRWASIDPSSFSSAIGSHHYNYIIKSINCQSFPHFYYYSMKSCKETRNLTKQPSKLNIKIKRVFFLHFSFMFWGCWYSGWFENFPVHLTNSYMIYFCSVFKF